VSALFRRHALFQGSRTGERQVHEGGGTAVRAGHVGPGQTAEKQRLDAGRRNVFGPDGKVVVEQQQP
jgi:hypothetical protein